MGAPVTLVDPSGNYVDASGGGSGTSQVEVTNFPATQPISGSVSVTGSVAVTGPLTNAQYTAVEGTAATAAYTDVTGAASGTIVALLKGLFVQQAQMITLLTQIETNTSV